eukprot:gi/632956310/ref/XP_007893895.1/ PREDICTED: uncharacterized protein C3orf38 homolog [Callorhinchus milii]
MTHFPEAERKGCTEILQSLDVSDLLSLSDTLSCKNNSGIHPTDAIGMVLNCSQSAEELLKRRKVLRKTIFQYLIKHEVPVLSSLDKQQLIDKALYYWSDQGRKRRIPKIPAVIYTPKPVQKTDLVQKMQQELEVAKRGAIAEIKEQARRTAEQMLQRAKDEARSPPRVALNINMNISQQAQAQPQKEPVENPDGRVFSEQFGQWFFELLNSQNPLFGRPPGDWGPQHFWDDAVLYFSYCTHEERLEEHHGASVVSQRLVSLVKDERLLFNPNLSADGLKCTSSSHGLIALAVAGTVHNGPQCLGLFEQAFGLIRSSVGVCNWKIKFSKLHIKALSNQKSNLLPCVSVQVTMLQQYLNELHASSKFGVL